MKKYKLGVVAGAQLSFGTSFVSFLLLMTQFGIKCENSKVAGFTVSYSGYVPINYQTFSKPSCSLQIGTTVLSVCGE